MTQESDNYISDPSKYRDRSLDWYAYYTRQRVHEIKALVAAHPEIIEEHAANPVGYRDHPSPNLQRVNNYFRMQPTFGKYYIYAETEWKTYRIAEVREFGELPRILEGEFNTEEEAMHAVFMKRIEDLQSSAK